MLTRQTADCREANQPATLFVHYGNASDRTNARKHRKLDVGFRCEVVTGKSSSGRAWLMRPRRTVGRATPDEYVDSVVDGDALMTRGFSVEGFDETITCRTIGAYWGFSNTIQYST